MTTFSLIVAAHSETGGIGFEGKLPWKIPQDMRRFRDLTSDTRSGKPNALIMGRQTFDSVSWSTCAQNRMIVVISHLSSNITSSHISFVSSFDDALKWVNGKTDHIFVIGGAKIYKQSLTHPGLRRILFTSVRYNSSVIHNYDTFMPAIDWSNFDMVHTSQCQDGRYSLDFQTWIRKVNEEEQQYLDLIRHVLYNGQLRPDRTGTGVLSSFGHRMEFDLKYNFPLLTTKPVFFRGVVEELLWFLRGHTNANLLQDKNVHIWDGNGSREYLDSIGLESREINDLGPIYGFQWRHFGAVYKSCRDDYTGCGVDQIDTIIRQIKNNPTDRRIILNSWNVADLPQMALPPCHVLAQFYVESDNYLSCQMYQRSCDLGLGIPFNIASYALLTCIVADVCGLKPGRFIHLLGDTHIYNTHKQHLQEQIQRTPNSFPQLKIEHHHQPDNWSQWSFDDFKLKNYHPQNKIKMPMAV